MSWVGDEILALRTLFMGDDQYLAPTHLQVHGLRNAMAKVVGEAYRKPVLQLITGLPMVDTATGQVTTKVLTRHTLSVLIDSWIERDGEDRLVHPWRITEHGVRFLRACQDAVEAGAGQDPWSMDPGRL
jgi:hypothetical protein